MNADPIGPSPDVPPTKEVMGALYRNEVLRARRMSPEDKLLAGARLFDYACQITMAAAPFRFRLAFPCSPQTSST